MGKKLENIIDRETIDSTKYLLEYSSNPGEIINALCYGNKINEEFVSEFRKYITKENFSGSYRLEMSLVDAHPDLFDENLYKESLMSEVKEEVDLDDILSIINALSGQTTPQNNGPKEKVIDVSRMSISGISRYLDSFGLKDRINDIYKSVQVAPKSEIMDEDYISDLLNIDNALDELILIRMTDSDFRQRILLLLSVSEGSDMNPALMKYLSSDIKENLLTGTSVGADELIKTLCDSNDLGWLIKMIDDAVDGVKSYNTYSGSLDLEMVKLIGALPEDVATKLFKLKTLLPNAFSYKVVAWSLENKSFNESQLIEIVDTVKKSGNLIRLKTLAKHNGYNNLLKLL